MSSKPKRYCGRCRAVHTAECEQRTGWKNRQGSGRGGRSWGRKRKRIFKRDKYICQRHLVNQVYVFVELHGANHGVLDHIVPLAEGGTDSDENLQTICQQCDKEKTAEESARAQGRGGKISGARSPDTATLRTFLREAN